MTDSETKSFPLAGLFFGVALVALIAIGAWLLWPQGGEEKTVVLPAPVAPPEPEALATPEVENLEQTIEVEMALEEEVDDTPELPPLNESDSSLKEKIASLSGGSSVLALLVDSELIRKTVRAVHGLSEGWVVKEYRPLHSPKGSLAVVETGALTENKLKVYTISSANYRRYEKYMSMLTRFSPESAAQVYVHFYPLFEQAYGELGLREGSFQEATKTAINRILASTVLSRNTTLVQPSVMYTFADPEMESLSSLDKLKLRLGAENEAELQAWVKRFLAQISETEL